MIVHKDQIVFRENHLKTEEGKMLQTRNEKWKKLKTDIEKNLVLIEEQLESHVRFEERILFDEIQKIATRSELQKINEIHCSTFSAEEVNEKWEDEFWR